MRGAVSFDHAALHLSGSPGWLFATIRDLVDGLPTNLVTIAVRRNMAAPSESTHLTSTVRRWLSIHRLEGSLRLPPERELAEVFCVSRSELRKALAVLEDEGQLTRHVGRGTFIAKDAEEVHGSGRGIAALTSPSAAMEARLAIEPELGRLAALNATSNQIDELKHLCREMRGAQTWEEYAELDWRFHDLIAKATGNILLTEIQSLLNGVRRYVVWGGLVKRRGGPSEDYHSFDEHEQVVGAIEARDAPGAMRAMSAHLRTTVSEMDAARTEREYEEPEASAEMTHR